MIAACVISGVFRISVSRGRCAVGVDTVEEECYERAWAPPQKKIILSPKMIILAQFYAVFN